MTDRTDTRLREVVIRVMEMAPPTPPFPEDLPIGITPEPPQRRRRYPALVVAGVAVAAILLVGIPLVLRDGGSDPATPSPTTPPVPSVTTAPPAASAAFTGRLAVPASSGRVIDLYVFEAGNELPRNLTNITRPDGLVGYPSFSPTGEQVVFEARLNTTSLQVFVVNVDGSGLTRLTNDETQESFFPQWSPDGSRILFVRSNQAYSGAPQEIWSMNTDGTAQVLIAAGDSRGPVWAPDGETIAFLHEGETWLAPAARGESTRLTDIEAAPVEFSPDGSLLIVEASRNAEPGGPHDQASDLWLVSVDGTAPVALAQAPGRDWVPTFSADGSKIVFTSDRDGDPELYVVDVDGTNLTRLTEGSGIDGGGRWSSDGSRILFMSEQDGAMGLRVVASDGSGAVSVWPQTEVAKPIWFVGLDWHSGS